LQKFFLKKGEQKSKRSLKFFQERKNFSSRRKERVQSQKGEAPEGKVLFDTKKESSEKATEPAKFLQKEQA